MHRRTLIAAAGTGVTGLLAGCASIAGGAQQDDVTVEELAVDELAVEQTDQQTIQVSGTGAVETEPDRAAFSVAVEAHDRDDAAAVIESLAEQAEAVRDALLAAGIPEDDITTERYSLRENSRQNRYEGEHRYAVEVDDPDRVGSVIDRSVDAGADSIGRIEFTVSESRREALYDEAVEEAVADARREAELYTEAADQQLGEPTSIETTQTGHSPFRQQFDVAVADDADAEAATQIDQGQVAVTADVTIEYEFSSRN